MKHPIETYHHHLVHSHFSGECTACPHSHPEIEHQVWFVGLLAAFALWFRR